MKKSNSITLPDISDAKLTMAYPSGKNTLPDSGLVLAADVGGTKTNLALFEIQKQKLVSIKFEQYATSDHDSFVEAIRNFRSDDMPPVDCACLGVAGIVDKDIVRGVNFAWEIDAKALEKELNIKKILLINDLQANAYGLSALTSDDFHTLIEGEADKGNAAIISPGTGLGEAGMYWDRSKYHPYATEGGHCSFGPRDQLDMALWQFLHQQFGHVSWERLVSGQGIYNIYLFLRQYRHEKEPEWLTQQIKKDVPPVVVSKAALAGKDSICTETLQLFLKYLSLEAAELALKTKATSGIYIGGGILPDILTLIDNETFRSTFINVGRMKALLEGIPVKIVLNEKTALIGAGYYAAMGINV